MLRTLCNKTIVMMLFVEHLVNSVSYYLNMNVNEQ